MSRNIIFVVVTEAGNFSQNNISQFSTLSGYTFTYQWRYLYFLKLLISYPSFACVEYQIHGIFLRDFFDRRIVLKMYFFLFYASVLLICISKSSREISSLPLLPHDLNRFMMGDSGRLL
jgi:hypothetical protein